MLNVAQFQNALLSYVGLTATIVGPFVAFAIIIHFLEHTIQKKLAERFGWASVMWTGWLGTPIHELSHAIMCKLFRHRIDAISLFEPDLKTGRLGYVQHSWRKGNWFEEMGNLFIGIAPLLGGSLSLLLLLRLFFPTVFELPLQLEPSQPFIKTFLTNTFSILFSPSSIFSLKFWIFAYLVLCVGSHMAPSRSDYKGAMRGTVIVATALIVSIFVLAIAVPEHDSIRLGTIQILMPLFAILIIASFLCAVVTVFVVIIVSYFPQRFRIE